MQHHPIARRSLWAAVGVVLAVVFAVPRGAVAQPSQESFLAGQLELARLVDYAAERLKLNIEYDSASLKGNVTLRLGAGVSDQELWELTNRVLASRGFTTLRMPGSDVVSVVKVTEALGLAGMVDAGTGVPPRSDLPPVGFQTVVVRLEHRPPKDVVEALDKVMSKPGGSAAALGEPDAPGGLVLISDLSPRVEQAMHLVRLLDVPPGRTVVQEIPLSNVGALQLATLIAQVSAKRELVSGEKTPGEVVPSAGGSSVLLIAPEASVEHWRGLIVSLDQRERVETVTYTAPAFPAEEVGRLIEQAARGTGPADDRWRLVVDDLTGTLIVTATPTQHEAIRALLERLASAPAAERRPVRSFVIRNRNVRELAEVLRGLLETGLLSEGAEPERGAKPIESVIPPTLPPVGSIAVPEAPQGEGERSPPAQARDRGSARLADGAGDAHPPLVISIDEATSTLIAMGEPRLLDELAALIKQLDVRQAQVMLEVLMVSLTDGQTLNLGVELEALDLSGDTLWRLASLFGLSQRGTGGAPNPAVAGAGLTGVVLNPGDFSVVLRALKTVNRGRSLSMPKVLVGNNQQATLDSIAEQPFSSTNASNSVATTTFGGSSVAGTQVSIKPQISEGDHLILDYQIALSSFTGAAANDFVPPPKQTNKVASIATIPDGFTVVVGGIDLTNDSKNVSQVPLLARIPIVGEAFKNRSKVNNRTRFYVFIRANVLRARGFEDLQYLSTADSSEAAVNDGFPELSPRVVR